MRPRRYSINVTLDGCRDHRAIIPDEDLHRNAAKKYVVSSSLDRAVRGHGPTLLAGLSKLADLKLVSQQELASGPPAMRYEPRR